MRLQIGFFGRIEEMKERMDLLWHDLFERSPRKRRENFHSFEKLPKFEGTGRKSLRSRSTKHNLY